MKSILTIQDVSCFGKCSLTIALPVLSAMGIETAVLPTALLSTHTLYEGVVREDLSRLLLPVAGHWKKLGIGFDAIYTGYLGSEEAVDAATAVIESFRGENTVVIVDPAMGDNGKLYSGFDTRYAEQNARLCALADVADPNVTEACLLTGLPYREDPPEGYCRELLLALARLGTKLPILTGVSLGEGKTGAMGYDAHSAEFFSYSSDRIPASCHGTGDAFSSVLAGAFALGMGRARALALAADFTALSIEQTLKAARDTRRGLACEAALPFLVGALKRPGA